MYTPKPGSEEQRLSDLFQAYRGACPAPDANPNFMPELWKRIEARQTIPFFLRRLASGFVTVAVALTLAMAVYLYMPRSATVYNTESYVEALANHSADSAELEPVRLVSDSAGEL